LKKIDLWIFANQMNAERRMCMKDFFITFVFALLIPVLAGMAAPAQLIQIHGLTFSTSLAFSSPSPVGLDALSVLYPNSAKPGTEAMCITAVHFPADAVGAGGMSDTDLIEYVKATFLAKSGAGIPVERVFLSHRVQGEAIKKSLPVPSHAEIYVIPLKAGDKIVIGFVFKVEFAASAGQVITEVAASLRE
jgi:hypothetical protein